MKAKPPQSDDPLAALERALKYRFRERRRLEQALTHSSHARAEQGLDNERLEFLGDAALGLRVAERLIEAYPTASEGEMSRQRAWLVSARHLATAATRLNLGAHLRLSRAEEKLGGRAKPRLLANAMEAVLAAIYLDGGARALARAVDRHILTEGFEPLVTGSATGAAGLHEFAYKSALQERLHAAGRPTPQYCVVAAAGPEHAKHFTVEVRCGPGHTARGAGPSKKAAEQAAAQAALESWPGARPEGPEKT